MKGWKKWVLVAASIFIGVAAGAIVYALCRAVFIGPTGSFFISLVFSSATSSSAAQVIFD